MGRANRLYNRQTGTVGASIAYKGLGIPPIYYVAATGNDANDGRSTGTPWQTLAKVNAATFAPGDTIMFRAGDSFAGSLDLSGVVGAPGNPITFTTYNFGRATISPGNNLAIWHDPGNGADPQHVVIDGINCLGSGIGVSTSAGVLIYNTTGGANKKQGITLRNMEISGFNREGIVIGAEPGDNSASGYQNVLIENVFAHDNGRIGVLSYGYGAVGAAHSNITVRNCRAMDNQHHGIVLSACSTSLIEGCVCADNGAVFTGGTAGIMVYDCATTTIRGCEVYGQLTPNAGGGNGINLDQNCVNCVAEYNYVHDCEGSGIEVYAAASGTWDNNDIRYNVVENCGANTAFNGAFGHGSNGGALTNCRVYNNIFHMAVPNRGVIRITDAAFQGRFVNNILFADNGAVLIKAQTEPAEGALTPHANTVFQGNNYWPTGAFHILWGGSDYTTRAAWRAAYPAQETVSAADVSRQADPLLVAPGAGGIIDAVNANLSAYRLETGSPMIGVGLNVTTLLGVDEGNKDFYGTAVPHATGTGYNIGSYGGLGVASQTLLDLPDFEAHLTSFFAEDAAVGPVSTWTSRGFRARTATAAVGEEPSRASASAPIRFTGGQPHRLAWPGGDGNPSEPDATVSHRWGYFIVKVAPSANEYVYVGSINGLSGNPQGNQPFTYVKGAAQKLGVQWFDTTFRFVDGPMEAASDTAYQFLVWHHRAGKLYANINGVWQAPVNFTSGLWNNVGAPSFFGAYKDPNTGVTGTVAATLDLLAWGIGQNEISDDVADKLVGLVARYAGREALLTSLGHPYGATPPVLTEADFGSRFVHDDAAFQAFIASDGQGNNNLPPGDPGLTARFAHRGELVGNKLDGLVPVFFDDFLSNTLVDNAAGEIGRNWFAPCDINPGANVNVAASNQRITDTNAYQQSGSDIIVRMYNVGAGWKSGSFASVNHTGNGRTWKYPMYREARCKFVMPVTGQAGGLWAGLPWSYNRDKYFWRTRSTIEYDDMENDGVTGGEAFHNVTLHVHNPDYPGSFTAEGVTTIDRFEKLVGYNVTAVNSGRPADLNWWDGQYHTIGTLVLEDYTYGFLDGRETFRTPTPPMMKEELSLILNWALRDPSRTPAINASQAYDMVVDYVKIMQPPSVLAVVPAAGFTARPTLSVSGGSYVTGATVTCTPNAVATRSAQLLYEWYRTDGSPIAGQYGPTLVLTGNEIGKGVRCRVRNVGVVDQPSAYTADSVNVTSSGAEWSPAAENANHLVWYDFQDVANTTVDTGRFSAVNDKSGNSRHATNATTGVTQPAVAASSLLGGKRAARSDGVDNAQMQIASPWTVASNTLVSCATDGTRLQYAGGLVGGNKVCPANTFAVDEPFIAMFHWGAWGSEWRKNGVVVYSDATAQASSGAVYFVGALNSGGGGNGGRVFDIAVSGGASYLFQRITPPGRGYDGDFGELIVRNADNDTTLRQKYEGYLAHHWGLTSLLAADHPWKTNPPS